MDPITIASTSASVAALCVKTVYTLAKWGHEVAGIDTSLSGLRGEIESIQSVVASLEQAIKGQELNPSKTRIMTSGRPLWAQVGRSIADAERVLQALDKIMKKFDSSSSGVFSKVAKQFKLSLESGEIATLRQRLVLINSALNLPMQMLSLQMHVERAEKDDSIARVLMEKITDMESAILAIQVSLSNQDAGSTPCLVDDKDIYGHIRALAETAEEFASDATVVLGNASSHGTVKAFPGRESRISRIPGVATFGRDHIPTYATGGQSIYGKPQPEEQHLQILNWIPPRTPNSFHEGPSNESFTPHGSDIDRLNSSMDDLEVELHGKRIAKGIALLENDKFEEAAEFFARALKRMEKRSATPEVQSLINDVKLLLAQSLVRQRKDVEAANVFTALVKATDGSDDAVNYSAKHALAELALRRGDIEEAEGLCLDAAKGRRRLFGPTNTACYASIKLLIDIYRALDEPDEVELWSELLPPTELPRHERFKLCDHEVRRLCSAGQTEAAVGMATRFLKDNYEMKPFWQWSQSDIDVRWSEMAMNIRQSGSKGFAGWSSGMCAIHFLVMATPTGAGPEIEYLLQQGASADATFSVPVGRQGQLDWNDCTCLMLAALHGRADIVNMILEFGADRSSGKAGNRTPPTAVAFTASSHAAAGGHFRLMQKLAAHGLGSDQPVTYPNAALRYALIFDQTSIVEWLIHQGTTGPYVEKDWATMLHTAAKSSSVGCMEMLVTRGDRVSAHDRYGLEPIHYAAQFGTPASVACLLDNGANIEAAECWHEFTPLLAAAHAGNADCGAFLISRGAKVTTLAKDLFSVLDLAAQQGHASFVEMLIEQLPVQFEAWMLHHTSSWSPVHIAATEGRTEVLNILLDAAPSSWQIDMPLSGGGHTSALDCAVKEGKKDCAQMLIKHGASVLSKPGEHTTIHLASEKGDVDMLRVLVHALPVGHTVDIRGEDGRTPLMWAAIAGKLGCVQLLLASGASALARDTAKGITAAHCAAYNGHVEVLKIHFHHTPWRVFDPEDAPDTLTELGVEGGHVETVQFLLELGVPMFHGSAIRRLGITVHWTDLRFLIEDKTPDPVPMARLLSEQYAKCYPNWTKKQGKCRGTLEAAIASSNVQLVEILLDAGFDVNMPLDKGQKPLAAAVQGGSKEMVRLLRRRGARE